MLNASEFLEFCSIFKVQFRNGPSAGVQTLNALFGDLNLTSNDDSVVITPSGSNIDLSVTASAGVSSLNVLTGALSLTSNDSSVIITPSGSAIDLSVPASPIAQQLWVNAVDGNDSNNGDISSPLATYEAARLIAVSTASPTNQFLIHIIGDQTLAGDFKVSPFVNVDGHNSVTITANTQILEDVAWQTLTSGLVFVKNCILVAPGGMSIYFGTGDSNLMYFDYCGFDGVPTLAVAANNTNSTPNDLIIQNTIFTSGSGTFASGIEVQDALLIMKNSPVQNIGIVCTGAGGTAGSSAALVNCVLSGPISLTDIGSGALATLSLQSSPMSSSPLMSGPNLQLSVQDVSSYTYIPTFSNGASISQVIINSLSDGIKQTSYTPVNFTPLGSANYSVQSNTAMIAGLDANMGINTDGITIVSSINTSSIRVVNSQSTRNGNIGTHTGRIDFTATNTAVTIIMSLPFGTTFTGINQGAGIAYVIKTSGGTVGDATMLNAITIASGFEFNISCVAGANDYSLYFSIQALISN